MGSFSPLLVRAAGLLGATGVGLGAFGAHGLKATLAATGGAENWKTAVLYQLVHAVALLALAALPSLSAARRVAWCWIIGVACFSGSLYVLALGASAKYLWPVTPAGGLFLITGWTLLLVSALRPQS